MRCPSRQAIRCYPTSPLRVHSRESFLQNPGPEAHVPYGRLGGCEYHGMLLEMAVIDCVTKHVGRFPPIGKIPDLITKEDARMGIGLQHFMKSALLACIGKVFDQQGSRDKAGFEAILNCAVSDGDGRMGLSSVGLAMEDRRSALSNESPFGSGTREQGAKAGLTEGQSRGLRWFSDTGIGPCGERPPAPRWGGRYRIPAAGHRRLPALLIPLL